MQRFPNRAEAEHYYELALESGMVRGYPEVGEDEVPGVPAAPPAQEEPAM